MAGFAVLTSGLFSGDLLRLLDQNVNTPQGIATAKFSQSILRIIPILVLMIIMGFDWDTMYLKRGKIHFWLPIAIAAMIVFPGFAFFSISNNQSGVLDKLLPLWPWIFLFVISNGFMDTYINLIHLRSRYYAPETGRFTTRDTWQGDYTRPLSLNRWNYVEGNPVNRIDPTGNFTIECGGNGFDGFPLEWRVNFAEKVMEKGAVGNNGSALRTYIAAGIAIQCAGTSWPHPLRLNDWANSGIGPAQISWSQINTEWGEPFYDITLCGSSVGALFGKNKIDPRGYGLRLRDEKLPQPFSINWARGFLGRTFSSRGAIEFMRRRIQLVLDECEGCTPVDEYIAAALAQNGPGFTHEQMRRLDSYDGMAGISRDWVAHFKGSKNVDTKTQLYRFTKVINELIRRGWHVPADLYTYWDTLRYLYEDVEQTR